MSDLLAPHEAEMLAENERTIKSGLQHFLDVGSALRSIRDCKLYRQDHKTFDDYLQARWGWSRSYASRLIQAAEVTDDLPIGNKLDNEAQARELGKAEPGKRVEVLEKAKEAAAAQGRAKPTAKDIREAVEQGSGKKPPQEAQLQEAVEARMPSQDGDCPRGGSHAWAQGDEESWCAKCFEPYDANARYKACDIDDDGSHNTAFDLETRLDEVREFLRFTIDQWPANHRDELSFELSKWAKEALRGKANA